jgi:hypothetical protein
MIMSSARQDRHVEFWMRESVPPEIRRTQVSVHNQLQEFEAAGTITSVTAHTWGPETYAPSVARETASVWEKFDEFAQWAAEHGCDLYPGFTQRRRSSDDSDGEAETVVLPILCVAVYEGTTLRTVTPSSTDGRVSTVHDCLAALDTGDSSPLGRSADGSGE